MRSFASLSGRRRQRHADRNRQRAERPRMLRLEPLEARRLLIASSWITVGLGDWSNPANWDNGVPNAVGDEAIFPDVGGGISANVNSPVTVGKI
ncbi:MAG: hypothetical protein J5I93_30265, partial [Pirellulaceae bacterium]|nr:hypothetical protein [Pirellulaceae bacterium]